MDEKEVQSLAFDTVTSTVTTLNLTVELISKLLSSVSEEEAEPVKARLAEHLLAQRDQREALWKEAPSKETVAEAVTQLASAVTTLNCIIKPGLPPPPGCPKLPPPPPSGT